MRELENRILSNRFSAIMLSIGFLLIFVKPGLKAGELNMQLLKPEEALIIKRFLHPMPQEVHLSDKAYKFSPTECGIENYSEEPETKQVIDDFRNRWHKKYKSTLKEKGEKLNIVAGLLKDSQVLQEAGKNGIFDAKYLSGRPNPEQAYTIAIVNDTTGKLTIYIAANDNPGLYYGLLTFEELLGGLSKSNELIIPCCKIVDWPDIKERGFCNNVGYKENNLQRYSDLKLNFVCGWIFMTVSPEKEISYRKSYRENFLAAKKYFIKNIPVLLHMDYLFKKGYGMDKFPELMSQGKISGNIDYGSQSGQTFCYSKPETQKVINQIFEAIAKADMGNRLQVWLSESSTCCHCPLCKGDLHKQFLNEIKHIMNAYQKAQQINPELKMDILLTQASYPYNYDILDCIPQSVGIDIYAGSGANCTYKTSFGEYCLTPQAEEIVRRGYNTGCVFSIGPALVWRDIMFPTYMTQFIKLRMSEMKNRGVQRFYGWMPFAFNQELNLEAAAEFSWNVDGRTSKEFIISWAERKGINNPEKVADIIEMLEYPIRAMSSGMRQRTMKRSVERMVSILNGTKPKWGTYFEVLNGFEYHNNKELIRVLHKLDHAIGIAKELQNKKLIAAAELVKQWVAIIERYAFFLENKDPEVCRKMKIEIIELVDGLPVIWERWINSLDLPEEEYSAAKSGFKEIMEEFNKLKKTTKEAAVIGN